MNQREKIQFNLIAPFAAIFNTVTLVKMTGQNLVLPFYHLVSNQPPAHVKHLYNIADEKSFRDSLDFLLKKFKPIDYTTLQETILNGEKPAEKSVFLSFDDGLRETFEVAAPILKEKGVPAAFFINSGFVDNSALFHKYKSSIIIENLKPKQLNEVKKLLIKHNIQNKNIKNALLSISYDKKAILDEIAELLEINFDEYLKKEQPYMSSTQISELIDQGFTIGAHSIDHPEYYKISPEEQINQTKTSVTSIQKRYGLKNVPFAFPFTDDGVNKSLIFDIQKFTSDILFGTAGLKNDEFPRLLHRIPMEPFDRKGKTIIKYQYLYFLLKKPFGKNTVKRKA